MFGNLLYYMRVNTYQEKKKIKIKKNSCLFHLFREHSIFILVNFPFITA